MRIAKSKGMFATFVVTPRLAVSVVATLLVTALLLGCGNRQDSTAPLIAGAIVITTPDGAVPVTGTMQFVATVTDANGNVIALAPTWSVANGGGTITSDGLFTAGDSAGTFVNTIVATSGAVTATSSVTVSAGALANISVTPATISLAAGATQHFVAVGTDAHGNVVSIANRVWSVAALGGTIDTGGVFTAGATAGVFANTVTATSGAISGSATVTVSGGPMVSMIVTPATMTLAIGTTQQYTVVGHDANNNVVPVSPAVVWTVGAGGTMSANGVFTAGTTAGAFANTVHAMSGVICADASVTVSPGVLATLSITPANRTIELFASSTFVAVGKDANDNVIAVTPTWTVVAGGGTIGSSTGVFTTGSVSGAFANTVMATSGSHTATASLTVLHGDLATIVLTPPSASVGAGNTQQFLAVGKDTSDNTFAIGVTWSVVAGGGTISGTGLFTASTASGAFPNTVRAASGALAATSSVTVVPGPATSVVITPASVSLAIGATQQFTAVATDAHGNVVNNAPAWLVVGGGGTMPETGGLYTAGSTAGTYTNSVTAQVGSATGTATVVVLPAAGPLATIVVTPASASLVGSDSRQFTATGYDAASHVVPIPSLVWSVSPSNVGTIDADGLFQSAGTQNGLFTNAVTATSGSITGHASLILDCGC